MPCTRRSPSLAVREARRNNGRVLLFCGAGCKVETVLAAIELTLADVAPDMPTTTSAKPRRSVVRRHEYQDAGGVVIAVKLRHKGPGAKFSWQRPSGKPDLEDFNCPCIAFRKSAGRLAKTKTSGSSKVRAMQTVSSPLDSRRHRLLMAPGAFGALNGRLHLPVPGQHRRRPR